MIRPEPRWLDSHYRFMFWITVLMAVLGPAMIGTLAWQGDVASAVAITITWMMASFSAGRFFALDRRWAKEAEEHFEDPCVLAGEHVEGCIYARSGVFDVTASALQRPEQEQGPEQGPEGEAMESTEISMCEECGALLDDSRDQRKHQGRRVDRCLTCAHHGLCPRNYRGPHEVVRWPEDPEFDAGRIDIGPLPESLRAGYCEGCLQPFYANGTGTFADLDWQRMGLLWARETGIAPEERHQAKFVHYWTSPDTMRLHVRLMAGEQQFHISEDEPIDPSGSIGRVFRALGSPVWHNESPDPQGILGRGCILIVRDGEVIDAEPSYEPS